MLAEPEEGEADGEAPAPESEAPAEAPPVSQTPTPVEPPKAEPQPEAPKVRTYSEEEWRKAQSSWQRQIQAEKDRAAAAQKQLDAFNLDAEVEMRLRRQEAKYEAQYGADDARKIVRDPDNVQSVKASVQAEQQLKQAQETERQYASATRQSLLGQFINQTVTQNQLEPDDAQALMALVTPAALSDNDAFLATGNAIGALAARLGSKTRTTAAAEQAKRKLVPPETAATKPETGASPGSGPMNHDQMLARVRQKPSWEWTDKEREFMRTGRV